VASAIPAWSGVVGTITLDTYTSDQTNNLAGGQSGVTITAHYSVSDAVGLMNCCSTSNLRWLQLVTSSTTTGFTPTPNRPFIDPRSGQSIGAGTGDALPWYDPTYPDATLTGLNNGAGPWIYDQPRVNNNRATPGVDYTFVAQSLLVCLYDDASNPKKITILGGFQWGFSITDQGGVPTYSTAAMPVTALSDGAGIRTALNTALGLDFPGYNVVSCVGTTCQDVTFSLVIPEPSSWVLMAGGILALGLSRIRRRKTSDN